MSTKKILNVDTNERISFNLSRPYPDSLEIKLQELKNKLENWKEILIPLYKILIWEKQWHPFAIAGATTSIFMFIWLSSMSVLTIFSLLGLIVTVCEYFVPILSVKLRNPDSWTPDKEMVLETLCGEILLIEKKIEFDYSMYSRLRESHPKMGFILTAFVLAMLAYFGNVFNNLLLMYLLVSSIILLPGARRTKLYHRIHEIQNNFLQDFIISRTPMAKKEE